MRAAGRRRAEPTHPRARSRRSPAAAAEPRLRTRGSRCRSGPRASPEQCAPSELEGSRERGLAARNRSFGLQELDVTIKAEKALTGIDDEDLTRDASGLYEISDGADHVVRLNAAPKWIVCVHRLEIFLTLAA